MHTHSWQALRPLCISSGEDLHSAPGRSTDKLPRQPQETEALAEGRAAAQKVTYPSHTLCGATPASHLTSIGTADRADSQGLFLETGRPSGHGRTFPPWGQEGLGGQCPPPPELALGQQPWGYRSQISPRFPNQRCQVGKTGPKCCLLP